jgi:DNA-binding MarR family transcriptional regulator
MTQLTGNFNGLRVRDTSIAALRSLDEETVTRNRLRILKFVAEQDGATCDEIEAATGMKHQSASALITRLSRQGRLRDTGERRLTRSGRAATVWGVVQ